MNGFNYAECNTNAVITIKKKFKQQTNNADARTSFLLLLADTSAATNNIAECLNSPSEIEKRLSLVKSGDVSFADDLLGLSPKGDNNSRYRAYLALDEGSIIEIRIGNHYETKKVILGKSNNKSQFLFQVVLVPSSPKQVAKDAVTTNTSVGNLKVLTSKIISVESTIEDLKNMLMSIHDYLESPTKSYEEATQTPINDSKTNKNMKKNVIKLNENTLRKIVAESVKKVLKEYTDPSTDGAIYPQNREEDIKRDAYRLKGKFIGDEAHRQSASDGIKTSNKYRRYDAWSEEDGINHGAPFYIPLLNAMNAAKKALNHEFAETINRSPNIKSEEQKFLEDKWQQGASAELCQVS